MEYTIEIWLGPGATSEHLAILLDAAIDQVPAHVRPELNESQFRSISPGRWVLNCDTEAWASVGTLLWVGLMALERHHAHEVWLALGSHTANAGYQLNLVQTGHPICLYRLG